MQIRGLAAADQKAVIALWQDCCLAVPGKNDPVADIDLVCASPDSAILVGVMGERVVASVMVGHDGTAGGLPTWPWHPPTEDVGWAA